MDNAVIFEQDLRESANRVLGLDTVALAVSNRHSGVAIGHIGYFSIQVQT
jgi:hypothetical protein